MDSTTNSQQTSKQNQEPGEAGLRRTKREHVHRYYSRVISLALSALDDGSQSPPPSRDLIEWILSALGFHVEEWTRLTDEDLVDFVGCDGRLNEEITRGRILKKIRKQRERLLKWQAKEGNPILVDHRTFFEHAEDSRLGNPKGKTYSEYQIPFGELIADIIEEAPAGTRDDKLKLVVKRHVRDYLARFDGTQNRDKKRREHSPESDLKRAATVARKAFEREEKKAGRPSAENAFSGAFTREFGGFLHVSFFTKSQGNDDLSPDPVRQVSPPHIPKESEKFWHTGREKNVAKLSAGARESREGSHPPEGKSADRGCDPPSGTHLPEVSRAPEHVATGAFLSVGCDGFEWFYVDPATDKKVGAYNPVTVEKFKAEISGLIEDARQLGYSLVVRVRGPVLQLDDCDPAAALLLEPFSFVVIETSANNFQCWLAFKDEWDKAEARARLFARLREIASGVNPGGGGAVRWPGSINQKPSRNGHCVRVDSINPGRYTTPSELEAAELLGDPPPVTDWEPDGAPAAWPDYDLCLKSKTVDGVCDRSRADAQFVYLSLARNRTVEEIAKKLAEVSARAKEKGKSYVNRTIAAGVEYLRGQGARQ